MNVKHTLQGTHELTPAIEGGRHASEPRIIVVATVDQPLARRDFSPQRLTLCFFGPVEDRIWSIASKIRYRAELSIGLCETIRQNDRVEVDALDTWGRRESLAGKLVILLVDDRSDVRCINATVALCGDVKG